MKTITLDKKEAKALWSVLNEGMPDEQKKRDFLAKISNKLQEII